MYETYDERRLRAYCNTLSIDRHPPDSIDSSTLHAWLTRHRHPRVESFTFDRNRWGDRARTDAGWDAHGTLFVTTLEARRDFCIVPCGSIPWATHTGWHGDERSDDVILSNPRLGWHALFQKLLRAGYLLPSRRLDALLGISTSPLLPDIWRLP